MEKLVSSAKQLEKSEEREKVTKNLLEMLASPSSNMQEMQIYEQSIRLPEIMERLKEEWAMGEISEHCDFRVV